MRRCCVGSRIFRWLLTIFVCIHVDTVTGIAGSAVQDETTGYLDVGGDEESV